LDPPGAETEVNCAIRASSAASWAFASAREPSTTAVCQRSAVVAAAARLARYAEANARAPAWARAGVAAAYRITSTDVSASASTVTASVSSVTEAPESSRLAARIAVSVERASWASVARFTGACPSGPTPAPESAGTGVTSTDVVARYVAGWA